MFGLKPYADISYRDGLGSLSYRVLECPDRSAVIQVDDKGHLTSGSVTGTASLQISSQETFGVNQTIIIAVKVKVHTDLKENLQTKLLFI